MKVGLLSFFEENGGRYLVFNIHIMYNIGRFGPLKYGQENFHIAYLVVGKQFLALSMINLAF